MGSGYQLFKTNRSGSIVKNKILLDLKSRYQEVAESWEYEQRVWSPKEWVHCFDEEKTRQSQVKSLSLAQMIDYLIDKFTKKESYKNGRIITSIGNAKKYKEPPPCRRSRRHSTDSRSPRFTSRTSANSSCSTI